MSHHRIMPESESGQAVVEELKTVTLLTIDIRGFSRMSKQLGPQRTVRLLNRFFETTGEVVFRHHGMVDKYLGDGFLAIFGAPATTDEDADNAVQASLEMKRGLVTLNRRLFPDFGVTIQVGMSLHTGDVVAGAIGFDKKMDYTVIGDAVNIVFRMQSLVKTVPNGILVSGTTLAAVRSRLRIQAADVPQQARRNLSELSVYELLELQTDFSDRVTAAGDESVRLEAPPNTRREPSSKLPPPILST